MESLVGVIPARYASSRFPGKLLMEIDGQSILEYTWRRAVKSEKLDRLIIAAADEKISHAARKFGADVIDIYEPFSSGSDRVAGAIEKIYADEAHPEIIVNIQGDEPLLNPAVIDATIEKLLSDPDSDVATAAAPFKSHTSFLNPSSVKVILDAAGCALYFSRSAIPYGWIDEDNLAFVHIGIYAFRSNILSEYSKLNPCPLERLEKLEQLRLLYYGYKVRAVLVDEAANGINTNEDFEKLKKILRG